MTESAPAPSAPAPAGRSVAIIVVGILIAAGIIFAIYKMSQPSDFDCSTQRIEYDLGERAAQDVDDACR